MSSPLHLGIFGSYNASSQGDLAILEGILTQLSEGFPSAAVTVFAFDPPFVQQALGKRFPNLRTVAARPGLRQAGSSQRPSAPSRPPQGPERRGRIWTRWPFLYDLLVVLRFSPFWLRQLQRLRTLDVLLIGGGGLLVDLYTQWPLYPLLYVLLARLARIPVVFYAVGVGPVRSRRGRTYFSLALNLSQGITVRDSHSFAQAQRLLSNPQKLRQAADPAFALTPSTPSPSLRPRSSPLPRIGLSTASLYRPGDWPIADPALYRTYIHRMAALAAALANALPAQILFFSTNCPKDLHTAQDILHATRPLLRQGSAEVFPSCNLEALGAFLPTLDLVIGTRLHSLILALLHQVPILALAYQEKVASLCADLGMADLSFPIAPLLAADEAPFAHLQQEMLSKAQDLLAHPEAYRHRWAAPVAAQRAAAAESLKMVQQVLQAKRP